MTNPIAPTEPTANTVKHLMQGMTHDDRPGNLWDSSTVEEKAIALKVLRGAWMSQTPAREKSEPVAWMMNWPGHSPSFTTDKSDYVSWFAGRASYPDALLPLYTAPQPPSPLRPAM